MAICIEINIDDQGAVTVGVCPPEEETGEPKGYMQPAKSVDDALGTARDLLAGQNGQMAQQAMNQPGAQLEQDPNAAAAASFNKIRGGM